MVAIKNMEMPSCCMNCGLLGKEKMYCSIYPRRDIDIFTVATNRPNWCPLVEIEERKVGKWIKTGGSFRCSECMTMPEFKDIRTLKYCPNCGAEMVGAENG